MGQSKDKDKLTDAAPRIGRISQIQDRVKDDYLANRILRDQFRVKKKERKAIQEADKNLLSKSGLEFDLVEEREDDVRMARLMNIQARTEAEEKQKNQRGDIEDEDIFKGNQSKDAAKLSKSEGKLFAVKTVGKAARSKQSDLLKKKGFGLVVSKIKEKQTDAMDNVEVKTKVPVKSTDTDTHNQGSTCEKSPLQNDLVTIPPSRLKTSNSLSLLGCEYAYSDSDSNEDCS